MKYLKKTFRWFGPSFGVSLREIQQLNVDGIVAACGKIPIGEVWPSDSIKALKTEIEAHGLEWSVVESVNVHNAIKYGLPERDRYIENYIQTLRNLAAEGIFVVCYNFMPLIDWTRTNLHFQLPSGAISLLFDPVAITAFDRYILKREKANSMYSDLETNQAKAYFQDLGKEGQKALEQSILAGMPGSKDPIALNEFKINLDRVSEMNKTELRNNLVYFLKAVVPEAEKLGVKLAIHPDDPPFPVFGIPRIAATYEDLQFVFDSCPSPSNGLTFCSGSLGATKANDLNKIIRDFGAKIHFIHLRNVQRDAHGGFYEASHLDGSVDMASVMKEIVGEQQRRSTIGGVVDIPMRPDHGHLILDDKHREQEFYPGYSLIGRAMGMAELKGLEMGIRS
ncbi:mannonate dehydratase [Flagellimonas myxillae]|uniref:mannonate dehydratase n=1 Tax=Flagellimonas myxillae TaxID=2942214 RepID=UPI00201EA122|nr:mannonate dehydratase [Muricauda myxillae]MCL6265040.1 mannonate dehydratase [Muricauda myxillae]